MQAVKSFNLLSDEELAESVKSCDFVGECLAELQDRHSGIFHQKVNKFTNLMEVRDLKANPISFFYEVATSYNPEKAKFSTWLGQRTFWRCHDYLKDHAPKEELQDNMVGDAPVGVEGEIYDYVLSDLSDPEEIEIFKKKLGGMTNRAIGSSMTGNYSGEWIRVKFDKIIRRYRPSLTKEIQ